MSTVTRALAGRREKVTNSTRPQLTLRSVGGGDERSLRLACSASWSTTTTETKRRPRRLLGLALGVWDTATTYTAEIKATRGDHAWRSHE